MGLTKDLGSIPRAITVSGSNNNVGISKETPNAKLDVNGNVIVTGSLNVTQGITGSLFGTTSNAVSASYATTASFATTATSASFATTASFVNVSGLGGFVQGGNSFGTQALIGTNDNQSLALETNGTVRMFVSSSGNVGVGTNSPAVRLDVSDDAPSGVTRIRATNSSNAIFSSAALELSSHNGSSVSVGTSLFSTNDNFTYGTISSNQTNLYGVRSGGIRIATGIAPIVFSNGNSDIDFATERMLITSGGNVLIGTTTDSGDKLNVNGSVTATSLLASTWVGAQGIRINSAPVTQGVYLGNSGTTSADFATIEMVGGTAGGTEIDFTAPNVDRRGRIGYNNTSNYMWFETNNGTERMRIFSSGNVSIGSSSPTDTGNTLNVVGRLAAQNFGRKQLTLQTTPQSLGLPINAGDGGGAYLLLISTQYDAGDGTAAALWMIRCGYSGNNFAAVNIVNSNSSSGITFSQVNGILHIAGTTNWTANIQIISNSLLF